MTGTDVRFNQSRSRSSAFFDTNVLIYAAHEKSLKADISAGLLAAGGIVSVQVLNEFASVSHRKLGHPWREVKVALESLRSLCTEVLPVDVGMHERALDLAAREGFSFYDALIVAAALVAGCETLWSEDMQDDRVLADGLRIRNPFRVPRQGSS